MKKSKSIVLILLVSILFTSCSEEKTINVDYSFKTAKDVKQSVRDANEVKFNSDNNLDLGFYKGQVWIKLDISNSKDPASFIVLCNDLINHNYRFYKLDDKNAFIPYHKKLDLKKHDHRSFSFAKPNFQINLAAYEKGSFLITTSSDGRILQASPKLISVNEFLSIKQQMLLFDIVFYSSILLLLLINLYYFRLIRSDIYFFYGAYILSSCIMYLFVEGRLYGLGLDHVVVDHLMFISIRIWILTSILFALHFLETKMTNPKFYRFIMVLLFFTLGLTTVYQFAFPSFSISSLHKTENLIGFMWIILSLTTIGIAYRKRKLESIYYFISYMLLLIFVSLGLIDSHTRILPGDPFSYFKIGTILEFIGFTYFISFLIKKKLNKTENLEKELLGNKNKLLITSEKLDKQDKLLSTKEHIKQTDLIGIFTLLENSLSTEDEWNEFTSKFQELSPEFHEKLLAHQANLTKSEIRLLTLIKVGYSQKEIAQILAIAPDSVKKAKSRVRKKINLPENVSLKELFSQL